MERDDEGQGGKESRGDRDECRGSKELPLMYKISSVFYVVALELRQHMMFFFFLIYFLLFFFFLHLVCWEHIGWVLEYHCLPFQGLLCCESCRQSTVLPHAVFFNRTKCASLPCTEYVKRFSREYMLLCTVTIIIMMLLIQQEHTNTTNMYMHLS